MPRRNRSRPSAPRPLSSGLGDVRAEAGSDGDWLVRSVPGAGSKTYRCPGCQQQIPPGVAHLVAWPADGGVTGFGGLDDRRHWHTSCWTARHRRR